MFLGIESERGRSIFKSPADVVVSTGSPVTRLTFLIRMLTHHSQAYFSLCALDVLAALSPTRRSALTKSLYRSLASIYQHYPHRGNKKEGRGMVTVDEQWSASFDSLTPFVTGVFLLQEVGGNMYKQCCIYSCLAQYRGILQPPTTRIQVDSV